jgi:hypothetical protein
VCTRCCLDCATHHPGVSCLYCLLLLPQHQIIKIFSWILWIRSQQICSRCSPITLLRTRCLLKACCYGQLQV